MDLHCAGIMEEYRNHLESFQIIRDLVQDTLHNKLKENGLTVVGIESRIKTGQSLAGKLDLKGHKYKSLSDITDIVGARIITFYASEVDKISSVVEKTFRIDWDNSVDKRKMLATDQFGYMSLHFICRIPKEMYFDPDRPEINEYRFEIQLRTALQHVWATVYHDTGYKSDIEVPKEYIRKLSRLAGMLEVADEQFDEIISGIYDYRRKVSNLIQAGDISNIDLDGDSFRSYLDLDPFKELNRRIASINKAEIQDVPYLPYLAILKSIGIHTVEDLHNLRKKYSDDAYRLAVAQMGGTDLDIIASTIGLRNLCLIYLIRTGAGEVGLIKFYNMLNGEKPANARIAQRVIKQAAQINIEEVHHGE